MKKVLIVADSLTTGGLEKTLIDLCNNLDYTKYNVDLYLFNANLRQIIFPEIEKIEVFVLQVYKNDCVVKQECIFTAYFYF